MSDDTPKMGRFDSVDAAPDPSIFLKILDAQDKARGIIAARAEAMRLLRPQPGMSVLDVGSGTGEVVRELARLVAPGGRVEGIDISETMVSEAARRSEAEAAAGGSLAKHSFAVGDATKLDFDDASFDAARSERVFQHVAQPDDALREMIRVVRPGGRIVVLDTDWDSFIADMGDLALERRFIQAATDRWVNGAGARRLPGMFARDGLVDIAVSPVGVELEPIIFSDFPFHPLIATAKEGMASGRISVQDGQRVIKLVEGGGGRSFAALMMIAVAGTKP